VPELEEVFTPGQGTTLTTEYAESLGAEDDEESDQPVGHVLDESPGGLDSRNSSSRTAAREKERVEKGGGGGKSDVIVAGIRPIATTGEIFEKLLFFIFSIQNLRLVAYTNYCQSVMF